MASSWWRGIHGLTCQHPAVRSRDWPVSDPLIWFVTRRLGIRTPYSYVEAFNRGDWFHRRAALWDKTPDEAYKLLVGDYEIKKQLIRVRATDALFTEAGIDKIIKREWEDMNTAAAWYEAMTCVPIELAGRTITVPQYFKDEYQTLGTEVQIRVELDSGLKILIQIDRLLLGMTKEKFGYLWIADWKTTSLPPTERCAMCCIEFQTWLYQYALNYLVTYSKTLLMDVFPQLKKCKGFGVGGMIHIPVAKPSIKFCGFDRDRKTILKTLKSGPRKGQQVAETVYEGEPKYANYIVRCQDWMLGVGDFVSREAAAVMEPAVNLSFTNMGDMARMDKWYRKVLDWYDDMRTDNDLDSYPPGSPRADTPYKMIYLLNPIHWPALIAEKKFYVSILDPMETDPGSAIKVLGQAPLSV